MSATTHRYRAYIALGSNQGVSAEALNGALTELDALAETQVQKVSPWYRSAAIGGPANQPDFLNAVCEIATGLEPQPLLQALHRIEHHFGRERQVRWGPRTLDLDIVWYEGVTSTAPELTLPHPRAHERAFVVRPLMDIAPDLTLHGETISHWLKQTENQSISRR
ncbi:2-amino-4-hydroxy-6-hydroxymethyldihydropteridine diphosphokinase [Saccharospirillum impatiens]|uniref:2-amino-4-hydroxy-6- hydroxymethyldihydropteridine diphosphokinase n=1 Tax=Saccharospirillum impatiens TaxID=169438 RepID=UPI000425A3D1|nr:2-amino-4-hydroxy-6-hydroxymethyldihydropteridine diphosphokinase [Saccharospirillum impatiens]